MDKIKYIDKEEKDLVESYSGIEVKKIKKPSRKEQAGFKKAAREFMKNEAKMNIRIDRHELKLIKKHAASEGLRYQTFVKSIIHKYITGRLVEKKLK
jgi:predicted DNA binding CopG/RHH family protein